MNFQWRLLFFKMTEPKYEMIINNNFNYHSIPHCAIAQFNGMYDVSLKLSLGNWHFQFNQIFIPIQMGKV